MRAILPRIPRETKVAAVVLAMALLQVGVLAALGLERAERQRNDAERGLAERAERAARALAAAAVRQVAGQEERLLAEVAREERPLVSRVQDALRAAPMFTTAYLVGADGTLVDARRPPYDPALPGVPDPALRARLDEVLALERSDPARCAEEARRLADDVEQGHDRDPVAAALALQCGARAARAAGDAERALRLALRLRDDRYRALRDDRPVLGESEPFGPGASLLVCEVLVEAVATGGPETHAAFVEALLDRRIQAQRLGSALSPAAQRIEREDCLRLRRAASALRIEHQRRLDAELLACDALDAALARAAELPRGPLVAAVSRGEAARMSLAGGSLVAVVPAPGASPWRAVAFVADAERVVADAVAPETDRVDAPPGIALVVRDEAGRTAAGTAPPSSPRLAEVSLGTALPGLRAAALLTDPSLVAREADAARRDWLLVLVGAGLAVTAASLLAVRAVLREVRLARLKSDFVSNLSHELRTPLTSLRMFVETLQEGRVRDEKEAKECLAVVAQETDRLTSLVDRILRFAAFAKGRAPIELRPEDPGEVARHAVQVFRRRAEAADAALDLRVEEGLPPAALDRDAAIQVILNLLDNAVKHSGHPGARIRVTVRREGRGTAVLVEDDGPGVPEKERDLVFEEFYRGDESLSRRTQGAGLGLALSRRIVLAHGGTIDVARSKDLGGAAFRVVFPAADAAPRAAAARAPAGGRAAAGAPKGGAA